MALTKVSRGLLTTSIVDNGNATAITIDSSENVGIGTTPATGVRLDIRSNATTNIGDFRNASATGFGLYVAAGDTSSQYAFRAADYQNNALFSVMGDGNVGIGQASPDHALEITAAVGSQFKISRDSAQDTQFMTIAAGGNAVTFDSYETSTHSTYMWKSSISGSSLERMRIDSAGRLCVNTSSDIALGRVSIAAGLYNTDIGMVILNTNTTYGSNTSFIDFRNSGGGVAGRISHTGGATVNYGTSSDERLKTNIQDADDAGDLIDSIQVRKFDWIADGTHQDYGMVAQELNLIAPLAAPSSKDPDDIMSVDYSKLVPMLVKEIQSLRTRVQELENN